MPSVHICTGPKTDEKCIVGLFFLQNVDKGYKCRYILYYNIFPDKNEKLALYGLNVWFLNLNNLNNLPNTFA